MSNVKDNEYFPIRVNILRPLMVLTLRPSATPGADTRLLHPKLFQSSFRGAHFHIPHPNHHKYPVSGVGIAILPPKQTMLNNVR